MNFIWVYGKEAHPGTECWDHPVTPTRTMAERAQRGRWMKYDPEPDLEIPMIIDFIAHESLPNDAIRASYGGGRPNTGYLIDCDGTILEQHDWAWSLDGTAPGRRQGELLDFGDLAATLEAYLEDPPACYQNEKPYIPAPTEGPPEPTASATTAATPIEPTPTRAVTEETPEIQRYAIHVPWGHRE